MLAPASLVQRLLMDEILSEKSAQMEKLEDLAASAVEEANRLRAQLEGGALAGGAGGGGAGSKAGQAQQQMANGFAHRAGAGANAQRGWR